MAEARVSVETGDVIACWLASFQIIFIITGSITFGMMQGTTTLNVATSMKTTQVITSGAKTPSRKSKKDHIISL